MSVVTTAVFVWLTTLGCLACCAVSPVTGCGDMAEASVSAYSCCTTGGREEANAPDDTARAALDIAPEPGRSCPILASAPGPFDVSRAVETPAALPASVSPVASTGLAAEARPVNVASYVANRGDTHLRCCVFLI